MAKQEVGQADYEVRSATGGARHITLARWARALLSVVQAFARGRNPGPAGAPRPAGSRHSRAGSGLVLLALLPPGGREGLSLATATKETFTTTTVVLGPRIESGSALLCRIAPRDRGAALPLPAGATAGRHRGVAPVAGRSGPGPSVVWLGLDPGGPDGLAGPGSNSIIIPSWYKTK